MSKTRLAAEPALLFAFATLLGLAGLARPAHAQPAGSQPLHFQVSAATQNLEMIVNTSRILTLNHNVPRLLVQNPDIIQATPLSPNQIQVSALKPGVTALNVWNEKNQVQAIDVRVFGDVRELQEELKRLFPDAAIDARPLNSSLLLTGHIPQAQSVNRVVEIAREYFPKVINHLTVGGVQTVALHVKVMEVSRTKLRQFGVDWAQITGNDFVIQSASGLINAVATQSGVVSGAGDTMRFGVVSNGNTFGTLIDVLKQNSMAKVLAEPTLTAISGRPARFVAGGEVPIAVSGGLGVTTVEFREFGTIVDFVPIVMGNGRIRLEVRPHVTEIDPSLRDPVTGTPGFRSRGVDTGVEMMAGQTLALAGLIQTRVEAEHKGVPWLSDLPWLGAAFRRVQESVNEVELLIMVTPELIAPLDPHEAAPCGPGGRTTSPNDVDLYWRGYIEVPKCCTDGSCSNCQEGAGLIGPYGPEQHIETLPPADDSVPPRLDSPGYQPATPAPAFESTRRSSPQVNIVDAGEYDSGNNVNNPHFAPAASSQSQTNSVRQNPSQTNNTFNPNSENRNAASDTEPALFGPIGYDVLN